MTNQDATDSGEILRRKRLFALIHADVKKKARRLLAEHMTSSLNTDGLVSETYIKLIKADSAGESRIHFFRIAALAMRQIIVDHARARLAKKRMWEIMEPVERGAEESQLGYSEDLLTIDAALKELSAKNARMGQIVELHFFGGLKFKEIAEQMEISVKTIERDWRIARSELYAFLNAVRRNEP